MPGGHSSHIPFTPACATGHRSHAVRSGAACRPGGHSKHVPSTPALKSLHKVHSSPTGAPSTTSFPGGHGRQTCVTALKYWCTGQRTHTSIALLGFLPATQDVHSSPAGDIVPGYRLQLSQPLSRSSIGWLPGSHRLHSSPCGVKRRAKPSMQRHALHAAVGMLVSGSQLMQSTVTSRVGGMTCSPQKPIAMKGPSCGRFTLMAKSSRSWSYVDMNVRTDPVPPASLTFAENSMFQSEISLSYMSLGTAFSSPSCPATMGPS